MSNEKVIPSKAAKFLKGMVEVAPNATHYIDNGEGHWVAGVYVDQCVVDTDYGPQRRMLLREAQGEGLIAFGDDEKVIVELTEEDTMTEKGEAIIVSVGLTGIGERLFESALARGLVPGVPVTYVITGKGEKKGKRNAPWIVQLNVPKNLRPVATNGRRGRRDEDDSFPFGANADDTPENDGAEDAAPRANGKGKARRRSK